MTPQEKDFLKAFHQSLADHPLESNDPKYVSVHKSGDDPINELEMGLEWQSLASVNLLLGQKGSGKSTELRRLKGLLETSGYAVFLCDMTGYLNPSEPLEVGDLLISIMGAFNDAMVEQFGSALNLDYWNRMTSFLEQEIKLDHISMKGPGFDLKASLSGNPDFKELLQKKLRSYTNQVMNQAREFASECVDRVRKETHSPNKQVVLLVDSLEKQRGVGRDKTQAVYDSMQKLFSGDAQALQIPKLHMVYSIPPYLPTLTPNLGSALGGAALFRLPSVHVQDKNGNPDDVGLAVMIKIVDKRFSRWSEVFSNDQMNHLAVASGGDIRAFLSLIQRSLIKGASRGTAFPMADAVIDRVKEEYKSEFLPIAKEDARWLQRILSSKSVELDKHDQLSTLARFFDGKLILNYRNGSDWCDVHPLLQDEIRAMVGDGAGG